MPFFLFAVEGFHIVEFAVFQHGCQFVDVVRAFHPKTGLTGGGIRRQDCRRAFVPGHPIAVGRLKKAGVGMYGFAFGIDQHPGGDFVLKRQCIHFRVSLSVYSACAAAASGAFFSFGASFRLISISA